MAKRAKPVAVTMEETFRIRPLSRSGSPVSKDRDASDNRQPEGKSLENKILIRNVLHVFP